MNSSFVSNTLGASTSFNSVDRQNQASKLITLTKTRSALLAVALGAGLMAITGHKAHATSTDCSALNTASYSANANGNFSLNSFQLYTLDAGEIISFSANVPAGASVTITFSGIMVVLDNSTGTSPQNRSGSITVPSSGTTTTSAVLIAVNGLITGGSVNVNFDCAGITPPPPNNANTGNNVAPAVIPVVSVSGTVNPQYGAVADSGVEAFINSPGFGQRFIDPGILPGPLQFVIDAAKKKCEEEIAKLQQELVIANKEGLDNLINERELDIEAERIVFKELIGVKTGLSTKPATEETLRRRLEELKFITRADSKQNSTLRQDNFSGVFHDIAIKYRRIFADREAIDNIIKFVENQIAEAKKKCPEDSDTSSSYISQNDHSSGTAAISRVLKQNSTNTPYTYSANLTPGVSGIIGNFALANPKAKRQWVLFLNTNVSGLDDNRTGADRRARIWNVSAGGSIRLNTKTNIGVSGGYRQGEVTSKANASKLTGDYFSATISGDYLLMKTLSLGLAATYIHGDNTLAIGGGTGDFGVDVFKASVSLSGAFKWQELTISPSLSAGISRINRNGYTDNLGVIVPGSEKTHGNVNFGASVSKTFLFVDGFKSITPSLSLGGGYFFRENFDATLTSGTTAKQLGFGANLATGLDLRMDNGIGVNIGGSYGLFQNDIQIWSLNAKLSKVF